MLLLMLLITLPVISLTEPNVGDVEYVHQWGFMDYDWPSEAERQQAIADGSYIKENCIITGIKIHGDDIYLTIPRWLPGVPSTMNKLVQKDDKYVLQPFPSWQMQEKGNCARFQFTQSMEIDAERGEMWVIDRGEQTPGGCPPKILVLDIESGEVRDSHNFLPALANITHNFVNDIVIDPARGFAYTSESGQGPHPSYFRGGILVYDRKKDRSHRLEHHLLGARTPPDCNIVINSESFGYCEAHVNGISLSPDKSWLHFCPLGGYDLLQMSAEEAREYPDGGINPEPQIRVVGRKVSQTDGMVMGHKGLYIGAMSLNAVYSWQYAQDMQDQELPLNLVSLTSESQVHHDDVTMQWPDSFAMDGEGWVYTTTNRLPFAMERSEETFLNFTHDYNFRVVRMYVNDVSYLQTPPDADTSACTSPHAILLIIAVLYCLSQSY